MLRLRVVKESSSWLLVDKPAGFHTHPPEDKSLRISPRWNALAILERQMGQELWPVHRLDRATSGLLLFSKDRTKNYFLQNQFAEKQTQKTYFALVRGTLQGAARLDEALKSESGQLQEAVTEVEPYFTFSLPIPHPHGGERTFTVLKAAPVTGRFHQIRRHLARAGLPLLGDSRHGDRRLNREFAELTGCRNLFLRCMGLEFRCPSGDPVEARVQWSREWHALFGFAGACPLTASPSPARPSPS